MICHSYIRILLVVMIRLPQSILNYLLPLEKKKKIVNFNTNYKQFSWRTNWIRVNWWDAMSSCLHLKSSHWLQRHQLYSLTIEENVNDNQQNVNDNE